jgi:very-short-patch-repair endonuclease
MKKRRNLSIDDLHLLAKSHNGICLSTEYVSSKTLYEWKCSDENHPSFFASHNQIDGKNTWCAKCGHIRRANAQRGTPGKKFSEERKIRFSQTAKERGFGQWMKGRIPSPETIEKIRIANLGRSCDNETRIKISIANTGENNGMFGKSHSSEALSKISKASKLSWENEETRLKREAWFASDEGKTACKKGQIQAQLNKKFEFTKPEREVADILVMLQINYIHQFLVDDIAHSYVADFYLPEYNTIIEVDGKYWHNFPHGNVLDHIRTMEMTYSGYNVIRLWENEFSVHDILDHLSEMPDYYTHLEKMEKDAISKR